MNGTTTRPELTAYPPIAECVRVIAAQAGAPVPVVAGALLAQSQELGMSAEELVHKLYATAKNTAEAEANAKLAAITAKAETNAAAAVAAAEWENGTKVYARHDEGEAALWYDPESGKLHDHNEAARVATEAEADALALEWLVCRMQDEA